MGNVKTDFTVVTVDTTGPYVTSENDTDTSLTVNYNGTDAKYNYTSRYFSLHLLTCTKFNSFFYSVLRPFQDYFSSYETGQSVGGAKTGEPREKPPGTPASRTWLVSHVARAGLETTPDTAVK